MFGAFVKPSSEKEVGKRRATKKLILSLKSTKNRREGRPRFHEPKMGNAYFSQNRGNPNTITSVVLCTIGSEASNSGDCVHSTYTFLVLAQMPTSQCEGRRSPANATHLRAMGMHFHHKHKMKYVFGCEKSQIREIFANSQVIFLPTASEASAGRKIADGVLGAKTTLFR